MFGVRETETGVWGGNTLSHPAVEHLPGRAGGARMDVVANAVGPAGRQLLQSWA